MENNFDILIPGQHIAVAKFILDYAMAVIDTPDMNLVKRVAKEIVSAKYWEAYDCQDNSRQEYWRVVQNCIDVYPL